MARTAPRLYLDAPLSAGTNVAPTREQWSYLTTVLRLGAGDAALLFNGREGEWRARLVPEGRKGGVLRVEEKTRDQEGGADLHLLFAPLKHARLDYMAQKAVEMGVSALRPVLTRRTQVSRLNQDRLAANAVEAAEQCGVLRLPRILPEASLEAALAELESDRLLIFCDEDAERADPITALRRAASDDASAGGPRLAVLIGPEGGFDPSERTMLRARPGVMRLSLGPRILRADTAAVAALALVQACLGDWAPIGN
jgi:16S rRNA (uracil1498-N3)-methyltransferase